MRLHLLDGAELDARLTNVMPPSTRREGPRARIASNVRARRPTGDEDLDADDREDFWYHYKSPGLLEANPLGMVPTLVGESGEVVTESAVCVQFVDELARVRGGASPPLVDPDPFVAARSRCAADKVNRTVCSGYYRVLVRTEDEERKEGFAQILDGLSAFFDDDDATDLNGPFWGGRAAPGLPDLVLFPYAYRLCVVWESNIGASCHRRDLVSTLHLRDDLKVDFHSGSTCWSTIAGPTSPCRRTSSGSGAGTTRWSRSTPWRARCRTRTDIFRMLQNTHMVRRGPRSATRCVEVRRRTTTTMKKTGTSKFLFCDIE